MKKAKFENMRGWCNFDDHKKQNFIIISFGEIQCSIFLFVIFVITLNVPNFAINVWLF